MPAHDPLDRKSAEAYARGDLEAARKWSLEWLRERPDAVEPRILLAQVANRLQRGEESIRYYREAYELAPQGYLAYNLARIHAHLRQPEAAAIWYRQALKCQPDWAKVRFEFARHLLESNNHDAVAGILLEAIEAATPEDFKSNTDVHEAAQMLVHAAARAVAADPVPAAMPKPTILDEAPPLPVKLWSIVVCSIDAAKLAAFRETVRRCFAAEQYELIHIGDARSLCEGYNRGLAQASGEAVLFCHDDIDFLVDDLPDRLRGHLGRFDLIGAAGTTRVTGEAVFWSGHPYIHGWIIHKGKQTEGQYEPSFSSLSWPVVGDAQALDGVFLACRREVAEKVGFDERTFDGFHLYDLDFSYRAYLAGYHLAICCDLALVHASIGSFDRNWRKYADRFRAKFPQLTGERGAMAHFFSCRVAGAGEAVAVHAKLIAWRGLSDT